MNLKMRFDIRDALYSSSPFLLGWIMNKVRTGMSKWIVSAAACLILQVAGQVHGAYFPITSNVDLNANASISIAALGSSGTVLGNPFGTTTTTGQNVTFTQFASTPQRVDQGTGWNGNFLPQEALLWTRFGGPVTINFSGLPLRTFGLQIQPDFYGTFTAFVRVLNNSGGVLASFNFEGSSTNLANGSALFIGIGSDAPTTDFNRVQFGIVSGGNPRNFAFNSPDFQIVPEPGTYALAAVSVIILAGLGRSRRKSS